MKQAYVSSHGEIKNFTLVPSSKGAGEENFAKYKLEYFDDQVAAVALEAIRELQVRDGRV